jgi:3D (Asp-Asp-Asp) domain-containing protein
VRPSPAPEPRAAIRGLYSLAARPAARAGRLGALHAEAAALRGRRAALESELRLARLGRASLQRQLARRLRVLYDSGGTGTLEVIFGASSIDDATRQLDDLDRMTALDDEILGELRTARTRAARASAELAAREAALGKALRAAAAEAAGLESARAERTAYLARLASRDAYDARQLGRLEALARTAEVKSERLARPHTLATATATGAPAVPAGAPGTLTVVTTGYCLTGRTATGIPAGWGVAAVDPTVIPLGTRMDVPGYGEAIAADTGGAISGGRIDLWFPSCARAGGWGTRSVRIALH